MTIKTVSFPDPVPQGRGRRRESIKLELSLPERKVFYWAGKEALQFLPDALQKMNSSRLFVVADEHVAGLHASRLLTLLKKQKYQVELIKIPSHESHKNLDTVQSLFKTLMRLKATRTTPILALGGGVTTDLAGFAASTFMRGVPLVLIPTTVLAQVDAAIGGKTGVNLAEGKNLVGTFYHPQAVIADSDFLQTLSKREFCNGLPEIVKMAILIGEKAFQAVERYAGTKDFQNQHLPIPLLKLAIQGKIAVVEADPEEKNIRMILNLGHTFAHAIEAATHYQSYTHGEAVAIGLVAACRLSEIILKLPGSVTARVEALLKRFGLPVSYSGVSPELILSCMSADKKKHTGLRFILPSRIGKIAVKDNIPDKTILSVLTELTR